MGTYTNNQIIVKANEALMMAGVYRAPVNTQKVAEALGFKVQFCSFTEPVKDYLACFYDPDTKTIMVNRDLSGAEMLFAIAQQLGLQLLHPDFFFDDRYTCLKSDAIYAVKKNEEERNADFFALNLMAPLSVVREMMDEGLTMTSLQTIIMLPTLMIEYQRKLVELVLMSLPK